MDTGSISRAVFIVACKFFLSVFLYINDEKTSIPIYRLFLMHLNVLVGSQEVENKLMLLRTNQIKCFVL